jgi:hypothetical protein
MLASAVEAFAPGSFLQLARNEPVLFSFAYHPSVPATFISTGLRIGPALQHE